jgi:hypothetical protein
MGVRVNPTAVECLQDCRQACSHLGEANELRFQASDDNLVFDSALFKMRLSSAERALRRAKDALAKLDGPSHSRVVRLCSSACSQAEAVMEKLTTDIKRPKTVDRAAAKLLRHCDRSLEGTQAEA